jgi:hypothetical protein
MENKNAKTLDALREREREHSLEWRLFRINEKYTR